MSLTDAHKISTGSQVTIGLVDTGVFAHQDLKRNIIEGADVVPGGSGNGQTDRVGHGTGMAGLIVGHGRGPQDGILGIAPSAQLLPIKALADDGSSKMEDGIRLATDRGAKVINVSASEAPSASFAETIETANRSDVIVVTSAGNTFSGTTMGYPATLPGVLTVGAIGRNGKHSDFSLTGTNVGICAPGDEIVTTGTANTYRKAEGTSASTAIVSGAAALVRAKFPQLSAQEVVHRLTATATDIGPPGRDDECGFGVLNIVKALTADVPPLPANSATGSASPSPATASSPAAATPSATRTDQSQNVSDSDGPNGAVIAGILAAVAGLTALLGFLHVRGRRRSSSTAP